MADQNTKKKHKRFPKWRKQKNIEVNDEIGSGDDEDDEGDGYVNCTEKFENPAIHPILPC